MPRKQISARLSGTVQTNMGDIARRQIRNDVFFKIFDIAHLDVFMYCYWITYTTICRARFNAIT